MVSAWVTGAIQGLEKGLAAKELARRQDLKDYISIQKLQSTLNANKIAQAKRDALKLKASNETKAIDNEVTRRTNELTMKLKASNYDHLSDAERTLQIETLGKRVRSNLLLSPAKYYGGLQSRETKLQGIELQIQSMINSNPGMTREEAMNRLGKGKWKTVITTKGHAILQNKDKPWQLTYANTNTPIGNWKANRKLFVTNPDAFKEKIGKEFGFEKLDVVREGKDGKLTLVEPKKDNLQSDTLTKIRQNRAVKDTEIFPERPLYKPEKLNRYEIPTGNYTYASERYMDSIGTVDWSQEAIKDLESYGFYAPVKGMSGTRLSLSENVDPYDLVTPGWLDEKLIQWGVAAFKPDLVRTKNIKIRNDIRNFKIKVIRLFRDDAKFQNFITKKINAIFPDKPKFLGTIKKFKGDVISLGEVLNSELQQKKQLIMDNPLENVAKNKKIIKGLESAIGKLGNPYRIREAGDVVTPESFKLWIQKLPMSNSMRKNLMKRFNKQPKAVVLEIEKDGVIFVPKTKPKKKDQGLHQGAMGRTREKRRKAMQRGIEEWWK